MKKLTFNSFKSQAHLNFIIENEGLYQFKNFHIDLLVKIHILQKPKTKLSDRKNVLASFIKSFKKELPSSLTYEVMLTWLTELKQTMSYTDKIMSHIKCQLNHLFKWLVDKEIIQVNPLDRIKFRQNLAPKRARVILTVEEIKNMLEDANSNSPKMLYPFLYTIVHTGARRSEIMNLTWIDVDFSMGFIHLRKTKNGENRKVKMAVGLAKLLREKKEGPTYNYVFTNELGDQLHRQKVHRLVAKFTSLYPIPNKDWRCHDLRHSFAYNFLKQGGEMYQLKAILGHKTIQMTVDLYGALKASDIENPSPYSF